MTFKFLYKEKTYDVALTNRLIIEVEETYGKPIDTIYFYANKKISIMTNGRLAIHTAILNHLAIRENDKSLITSVDLLKDDSNFNWNSGDMNANCVAFILALVDQQANFSKLDNDKVKKVKKK